MAGSEGNPQDRFRAFVSYAHADSERAGRLQRRLEAYRLPEELGEILALEGAGPVSIGPIFRDREDLSAAADLSEAVRDALAASQALVVVCTPNTPRSRWVAREIELFRALHPERPVLAALFEGEPAESFPPALTAGGVEPLAADFRKSGDGDKLAFLKIVAGVLRVPLDRLIQRDAQRRLRRVTLVTAASLVLVLLMGAMTVFAITSRQAEIEARERAEAQARNTEELNSYFVTDFRQKLLANGRLDIAMEFYPRVLDYCEEQAAVGGATAESRANCAEVMVVMGSDFAERNRYELAEEYFEAAARLTEAQLVENPNRPRYVLDHANSANRLGELATRRERFQAAVKHHAEARDLLDTIADWGRERAEWLRQSAYVHGNLGASRLRAGEDASAALESFQAGVETNDRLAAMAPDDTMVDYDQAFQLQWLADTEFQLGMDVEASKATARYLAIVDDLVASDPDNKLFREQQMQIFVRHAEILRREGREAEFLEFLQDAREIAAMLTRHDPSHRGWRDYSDRLARMGE